MSEELAELQSTLDRLVTGRRSLRVLDAGCGARLPFDLPADTHVVGIDVSAEALARNPDVNKKIIGDIQTHDLPAAAFDVVVCWNVLEHLPRPELALENFARALTDSGILILALPNVLSLKGLVTKFTPHRFHVWVYRTIFHQETAGQPGYAPFKTFLRFSITPGAIERFAERHAFSVRYLALYEARMERRLRERSRVFNWTWRVLRLPVEMLSFRRIQPELSNCLVLLARDGARGRARGRATTGELSHPATVRP